MNVRSGQLFIEYYGILQVTVKEASGLSAALPQNKIVFVVFEVSFIWIINVAIFIFIAIFFNIICHPKCQQPLDQFVWATLNIN